MISDITLFVIQIFDISTRLGGSSVFTAPDTLHIGWNR
jgi:hypothetical protein